MGVRNVVCRVLAVSCAVSAALTVFVASALASAAPQVKLEWLQSVGATSVRFEALINPGEADTTYRFEYGAGAGYGSSIPVPDGDIGAGSQSVRVVQLLGGLTPGSEYHYRVVATNAEGTAFGPDRPLRTSSPLEASADSCPNAQLRSAQSAPYLPECRAYEMVSPPDKRGGSVSAAPWRTRISADGDAIQYTSLTGFGDALGSTTTGTEYIAERGGEGWATHAVSPTERPPDYPAFRARYESDFSSDFNKGIVYTVSPITSGEVSLADPNVEHASNLYLREDLRAAGGGHYKLLSGCPACTQPLPYEPFALVPGNPPALDGASADLSHVIFESPNNLTADASGSGVKLYESVNGKVRLAGILPDSACASPPCVAEESVAGRGALSDRRPGYNRESTYTTNTISADGSRIVFTAGPLIVVSAEGPGSGGGAEKAASGFGGQLYLREGGTRTTQLNVSERAEPDPNGQQPAIYEGATPDDSKIFFTTAQALTDEDAADGVWDLYMYDVNAPAGHHLTLITHDQEPSGEYSSAPRVTQVVGVSSDGTYVYFVGQNSLLPDESDYEEGETGAPNNEPRNLYKRLFVWHEGTLRHVVNDGYGLLIENFVDWGERETGYGQVSHDQFRLTPDGRHAVFVTANRLAAAASGYDNQVVTGPGGVGAAPEVYVYDFGSGRLSCASCDPSGQAPSSVSGASFMSFTDDTTTIVRTQHLNRAITDDGSKVFFDTPDPLVPTDTNGMRDVYEYDTATGAVHLISSGRSGDDSLFLETTADGSDVMFTTSERLVRADYDGSFDLYDARVAGGIAAQNAVPAAACESDDCQGPAKASPAFSLPASLTFAGAGNRTEPPVGPRTRPRGLTRAQKLARALRACHKVRSRHKRAACESKAKKRYRTARKSGGKASRRASR